MKNMSLVAQKAYAVGPTTDNRRRMLEHDAHQDLVGFDEIFELFTEREWEYIDEHYPAARQTLWLFKEEAAHRLRSLTN